jgi:cytochrome c oxidase subunit 2
MGHATIEWVYVGVVVALLIYVGADAWNIERLLDHAPPDAKIVKVTGQQWLWTFEHEDGTKEKPGELHLVKGIPYKFEITSKDVNHEFNVPDYTLLIDAIPGKINTLWVVPDQSGEFLIQCREYCGFSHYQMRAKLIVEEPAGGNATAPAAGGSTTQVADLTPSLGAQAAAS